MQRIILISLIIVTSLASVACRHDKEVMVKPRYHHTWYKKHTYKKKWRIGRLWFRPEKQGVKKVRVAK